MRRLAAPPCLALLIAFMAACQGRDGGPRRGERVDSAGIELVLNRGPDQPLDYGFTPRLTLGGKDEGPETFFRVGRGRAGVDAAGNIHVLDFDAKHIVVFDSTGRYLRTLGRPGQGPGELLFPNGLYVTPEGYVSVSDFSREGVIRWAPDGSLLPTTRIRAAGNVQATAVIGSDMVYSWTDYDDAADTRTMVLQRERPDSVETLAKLAGTKATMARFKGCGIMMRLPPLLSPELSWDARGSRIAVISKVDYEIAVHDSAQRMLVRRDVTPQQTTLEIAQREVGDSLRVAAGAIRCSVPPSEVAEVRGYAPVVPTLRAVTLAPDGSLWVQRGGPRLDPPAIDLFDAHGNYVGTLPPGWPVPIAFMPNGDVVSSEKDKESDVERLVVYRVRARSGGSP